MKRVKLPLKHIVFTAPKPDGLILWGIAKVLGGQPVHSSAESVEKWIKKKPKKEQWRYIPMPFVIPKSPETKMQELKQ